MESILIRGAREHNLKGFDLEIPRDRFIVITGLSGSGKSSLAFDTIYAEGQRRYVESLSAYARQFLEQMGKPDVESIDGLSPAISIEQKTTSKNPRSTIGTVTEVYDYLRLLFARIGHPHCPVCGDEIASQSVEQIVDRILEMKVGTRFQILAPVVIGRKGEYKKELRQYQKQGFVRAKIDREIIDLAEPPALDKKKKHDIDIIVDRLVLKRTLRNRIADSIETALRLARGTVKIDGESGREQLFSEHFACLKDGVSFPEITPQMFSFNNPYGACDGCNGLGTRLTFSEERVVPDPSLSIRKGAIAPWADKSGSAYRQLLDALARHYRFDLSTPFGKLPKRVQRAMLHGSGEEEVKFHFETHDRKTTYRHPFEGVIPALERRCRDTGSEGVRVDLEQYMADEECPACRGARLRKEAQFVRVKGSSIHDVTKLSIDRAADLFKGLNLPRQEAEIARRIVKEISDRLGFLSNVGLDYLSLDRPSASLSGGEGQRIRLATQIGSHLVGVLYILDEPSIGLHQRDNHRLLETLHRLRDLGNTVLVVEHDEATIRAADQVIDMGPGAGVHGGEIVATGTPSEIEGNEKSLTGLYLAGKKQIPVPKSRRPVRNRWLTMHGCRENNLKNITVRIPLGVFTCVTGVSGSGKSSLVDDTLYPYLAREHYGSRDRVGEIDEVKGIEQIDKVIDVDQSPIGRTPRSNPATYTGLFSPIRDLFTQLPDSKVRGYAPGRFSFNVKGGRCEACQGDGIIRIEMHFLPDVYVTCQVCGGKRYNRETLEIRYKGKSIAEILEMTVAQAYEFLSAIPAIHQKLQTLFDVGLGYIQLGQSATTLSGGEAQRVKLSKELSKRATGQTLYILDEPTTGLHFDDIKKLLEVLNRLTDLGNTVVVIEHNLEVIKTADYIIDLGPEGGNAGGEVVATGTPEEIMRNKRSYTGKFLRTALQ